MNEQLLRKLMALPSETEWLEFTRLESPLPRRESARTQLLTAAIHTILNGDDK